MRERDCQFTGSLPNGYSDKDWQTQELETHTHMTHVTQIQVKQEKNLIRLKDYKSVNILSIALAHSSATWYQWWKYNTPFFFFLLFI